MFKIADEAALLATFRPRDREHVELGSDMHFPMIVRGYTAWTHPAGGRVYLVFAVPGGAPTGIVFDSNGAGPAVPHLCDWCHWSGPGAHVSLLTTWVDSKKRVGVQVCADLGCKHKLEEEADRTGRSAKPAIEQLVARMGRFASEALKMDLTGARR